MENQNPDFKEVVGQRKPRVLMVEDEEFIGILLEESLKGQVDWEEGKFTSAQQAIDRLNEKKPEDPKIDLLITDLGLTDGTTTGTRVVENFRSKYPESSIMFLTGSPHKIDELYTPEKRRELNFEVMAKPFRPMEIMKKVDAVKEAINKTPQA